MERRAETVRSADNPRLKAVRALRAGRERGHLLLEGRRVVAEALAAGVAPDWLLLAEDALAADAALAALAARAAAAGVEVLACEPALLRAVGDLDSPSDALAWARRPAADAAELLAASGPGGWLLAAAGVQDPGNVGALVRVAAGLGAAGFIAATGGASPWHPRAVRGASGTCLRLPVADNADLSMLARAARARGGAVWAAATGAHGRRRLARERRATRSAPAGRGRAGRAGRSRRPLRPRRRGAARARRRILERGDCRRRARLGTVRARGASVSESLFGDAPAADPRPSARADAPLAERMRPRTLADIAGQQHLVGPGGALRRAFEGGDLASMILWGPPGTGKTTLAQLLAARADLDFVPFSAVLSGIKEVREAMERARRLRAASGRRTLLFVDEIHRFNKAQQDAFLPFVERGDVVLIGATTENPSFEVVGPLISRVAVHVLQPLAEEELTSLMERALADRERGLGARELTVSAPQLRALARFASGDARRALGALEAAARLCDVRMALPDAALQQVLAGRALLYDKAGDQHYDIISALHKSVRNSDPDAALYWLARMLEAGEDPLYLARRMVRMAAEDVGLADPNALRLAIAARDAFHFLGHPEGDLALAELAVYLALAPKSNAIYSAWGEVLAEVRKGTAHPVPLHIRNAPTALMKEKGWGAGYQYAHDEPDAVTGMECLPEALRGARFYRPSAHGLEARIRERLEQLRAAMAAKRGGDPA